MQEKDRQVVRLPESTFVRPTKHRDQNLWCDTFGISRLVNNQRPPNSVAFYCQLQNPRHSLVQRSLAILVLTTRRFDQHARILDHCVGKIMMCFGENALEALSAILRASSLFTTEFQNRSHISSSDRAQQSQVEQSCSRVISR